MRLQNKILFDWEHPFGLGHPNTACAQYFTGNSYLNPCTQPLAGTLGISGQRQRRPGRHAVHHSRQRQALAQGQNRRLVCPHHRGDPWDESLQTGGWNC